jgi:hypothetical protein
MNLSLIEEVLNENKADFGDGQSHLTWSPADVRDPLVRRIAYFVRTENTY